MTVILHQATVFDTLRGALIRAILKIVPSFSSGPEARPAYDKFLFGLPAPTGVKYKPATVGGVAGWWCIPREAREDPTILYLHGGAYVLGTAAAYRHIAGHIAASCRMRTFVPDYGLAPEHPFPAALDDAMASYRGMVSSGKPVALVGDSAGGGLCLALLLAKPDRHHPECLRETRRPLPDRQHGAGKSRQDRGRARDHGTAARPDLRLFGLSGLARPWHRSVAGLKS